MIAGVRLIRALEDAEMRDFLIKICRQRRRQQEAEAHYGVRF